MNPKVTIIMATYHSAAYLAESLASVAAQSFTDYEFRILDDASTDDTMAILENAARSDPRIHVERNPENRGVGWNFMRLLAGAGGTYVAQMGQDDRWHPDFLRETVRALDENPVHSAVFGGIRIIDGAGKPVLGTDLFHPERLTELSHPELVSQLIGGNFLCAAASLFRRSSIVGWSTQGANDQFQDWNIWQRLSLRGTFGYLPYLVCEYRIHGTNLSLGSRNPGQIRIEQVHTRLQMLQSTDFAQFILNSPDADETFANLLTPFLATGFSADPASASCLLYVLGSHESILGHLRNYRALVGALFWVLGAHAKARRYLGRASDGGTVRSLWKHLISTCEWRYLILIANPRLECLNDSFVHSRRFGGVVWVKSRVMRGRLRILGFRLDRKTVSLDRALELHQEALRLTYRQKWSRVWGAIRQSKGRIFIRYLRERVMANGA